MFDAAHVASVKLWHYGFQEKAKVQVSDWPVDIFRPSVVMTNIHDCFYVVGQELLWSAEPQSVAILKEKKTAAV